MNNEQTIEKARQIGREHGKAKASWAIEPDRLSKVQMQAILEGIENVDPRIMDQFSEPSLSGEFADDMNTVKLCNELDVDPHAGDGEFQTEICDAWEEAARDTYWAEIQKTLQFHTEEG